MKRILFITIITAFLLSGCGERKYDEKVQEKLPVEVTSVYNGTVEARVYATADIYAHHSIDVSTKLMSRIEKLPFDIGDEIKKGDLLFELDSSDIQSKIKQAEASLKEGEANLLKIEANKKEANAMYSNVKLNFNRMKTLFEKGSIEKKNYDDAKMQLDIAQSKLEAIEAQKKVVEANIKRVKAMMDEAQSNLNYTYFKSPFNGFVTCRKFDPGNMTAPGAPIMRIKDIETLNVDIKVSELDIDNVNKDNDVIINIPAISKSFKTVVKEVVPAGDMLSRAFVVRAVLDNKDKKIKPGMFSEAQIIVKSNISNYISREAIIESGKKMFVFKINKDNKVKRIRIKPGIINQKVVEILDGVEAGDRLVTSGKQNVSDGSYVRVVSEEDIKKYGTL